MVGKKTHRRHTGARFGVAVVIRVGVDVIDIGRAFRIDNEFERCDIEPFASHHRLHARHQRGAKRALAKSVNHLEGESQLDIGHAGAGIERADIGRAQLESVAGTDPHCIDKLTADELDPCDALVGRRDVPLDQRDAVDRRLEIRTVHIIQQRLAAAEQLHAKPLAGTVVLGDGQNARTPRSRRQPSSRRRCREPQGRRAAARHIAKVSKFPI